MLFSPLELAIERCHHPGLSLEPFVELGRELEVRLVQGELDFAMLANQPTHPALKSAPIAQVQFTWVVSTQSSITQGSRVEDIAADVPIITMHKNGGSNIILNRQGRMGPGLPRQAVGHMKSRCFMRLPCCGRSTVWNFSHPAGNHDSLYRSLSQWNRRRTTATHHTFTVSGNV